MIQRDDVAIPRRKKISLTFRAFLFLLSVFMRRKKKKRIVRFVLQDEKKKNEAKRD